MDHQTFFAVETDLSFYDSPEISGDFSEQSPAKELSGPNISSDKTVISWGLKQFRSLGGVSGVWCHNVNVITPHYWVQCHNVNVITEIADSVLYHHYLTIILPSIGHSSSSHCSVTISSSFGIFPNCSYRDMNIFVMIATALTFSLHHDPREGLKK